MTSVPGDLIASLQHEFRNGTTLKRRILTIHDPVEIGVGLLAKLKVLKIAEEIDRSPSVVSREIRRNQTRTRGYKIVTADCNTERRRG